MTSVFDVIFSITVECQALLNPPNGRVTTTGIILGSIAIYNCDFGYSAVGNITRVCLSNGNWSGSVPICQGMLIVLILGFSTQLYACTVVHS